MESSLFARSPIRIHGGIPVFSQEDAYTRNYEQISGDHLDALEQTGVNPFIPEQTWRQLEASTASLIEKYSKPGDSILDVGVGLGRLLSRFPSLDRYGMDISLRYLAEAEKQGIHVCYARVEDMPYEHEVFDLVVCTDVLEHVLDLNLACQRILDTLKPGGVLIIRVPYREDLSGYCDTSYPYRYAHLRSFDEHGLRLLLERIHGCQWLETLLAGSAIGFSRLRCPVYFTRRDGILLRMHALIRSICPPMNAALTRWLYFPLEINAVVRKT